MVMVVVVVDMDEEEVAVVDEEVEEAVATRVQHGRSTSTFYYSIHSTNSHFNHFKFIFFILVEWNFLSRQICIRQS